MDSTRYSFAYVVLFCFISSTWCETTVSNLKESIGLTGDGVDDRRAVIILGNTGTENDVNDIMEDQDLVGLGMDMDERDPNSLFVHYNGDSIITSQPSLFGGMENTESGDVWNKVLDRVKAHRTGEETPLADLLVFDAHPENFRDEITKLCDTLYATGKCKILNGRVAMPEFTYSRVKRAEPTTTPKPDPAKDPTAILPKLPYPASFQLLFWTTLLIFLTVYGVAYAMWHMDPGRDSIIYRMTSAQKYKKDK